MMIKEVNILKSLDHKHMAKLIMFKEDAKLKFEDEIPKNVAYIQLEQASNGRLTDYISLKPFSERIARYYCRQMIDVLQYCHSKGVVLEEDIHPGTFLLDDNFNVLMSCFGEVKPDTVNDFPVGSCLYVSRLGYCTKVQSFQGAKP